MHDLALMTWNVRYFGHGLRGLRATRGRIRRIARAVAEAAPDLVALQEVEDRSLRGGMDRPQIDRFMDALHAEARALGRSRRWRALYYPAHRYQWGRLPPMYTTGLAILVADHLEIEDHNAGRPHPITHVRLPRFAALKQTRIAAHARVRDPAREVAVDLFNTHFSLPAFFEVGLQMPHRMGAGSNQLREAQALIDFVRARRAAPHAIVVGDLNSSPGSPAYEALARAGLRDGFGEVVRHDEEVLRRWSTARFLHHRMHIDHVFSTPGVRWLEWEPHTACRGGPFHQLSDHAPKLGRARLERAEATPTSEVA